MAVAAWFQILVGVAIMGLWGMLLATRRVPQVAAGTRDIWFHLAAELLTGILLVGSGIWLLARQTSTATMVSALALGALLYTTINSPGYYADRRDWSTVAMFVVLALATTAAALTLLVHGAAVT